MQDGLFRGVKVIYSLGDVECELFPVVPCHFDLHIVKQTPEGAAGAILEDDCKVGLLGAGSKEEDDIGMTNDFHDSAFVLKFFELVLLDNLSFDLFDGYDRVLPATSVHDSISSLRELSVVSNVTEWDLIVLNESSSFV